MKTKLPESITTIEEATNFLTELNNNGEIYHPDDDAHDIIWHCKEPSFEEKEQLNKLMDDIFNLEEVDNGTFDPYLVAIGNPTEE